MMKVSIAVAVLLVAVVGCNGAVSAPDSPEDMGAVRRILRFFAVKQPQSLSRVRRQAAGPCQSNADCLPTGITNATADLARCVAGQCLCMLCFSLDATTGRCQNCSDYLYDERQGLCGLDNRPRQLTAFLLSLFLSSTGAANFYIGQTGLGAGQIVLIAIVLLSSYVMCCLPCCLACCVDDVKGSILFIILMLVLVLVTIGASLAMTSWWIADLVIFATNQRLSGNGCMLTPNL